MKITTLEKLLGFCFILIGGFSFTSCTNSDFDLSSVDATIGLGDDTLSLPSNNSTDSIQLDDILDLGNNDFVKIASNGDYMFSKSDNNSSSSETSIDEVKVSSSEPTSYSVDIELGPLTGSSAKSKIHKSNSVDEVSFGGSVSAFDYKFTSIPSEIEDLSYASVSSTIITTISFSESLKNSVNQISSMTITLPKFLDIESVEYNGNNYELDSNHSITINDVSTSSSFTFDLMVKGLNFNAGDDGENSITFKAGEEITAHGFISLSGVIEKDDVNSQAINYTSWSLAGSSDLGSLTITNATGQFKPSFTFDNLGKVTLSNIPDFLSDSDVVVDLWNPQIDLSISSDLPLDGKVSGELVSKDANGNQIASVQIPEFVVKSNESSVISIRKQSTTSSGDTTIVVVSDLSDIIKTIPNSIEFVNVKAVGDETKTATIDLGHNYTITSQYAMSAPLAFDSDAQIVYSDTIDGWNDGLKDLNFTKFDGSSYIKMTTDVVNQIPVNLQVEAYAIDENKNEISSSEIEIAVDSIIGKGEDNYSSSQPITVKITPKNSTVIKKIDGIIFKAIGSSSENMKGITLNAYSQTLKLNNIKITKVGQIVGDFN